MSTPSIRRIGLYRTDGRNGLVYDLPAVVNCTPESHPGDYPDGTRNPLAPPDEGHVHLTVFSPGGYGTVPFTDEQPSRPIREANDEDFVGAATFSPGSGTYVELNVPVLEGDPDPDEVPHRTFRMEAPTGQVARPTPSADIEEVRDLLRRAGEAVDNGYHEKGDTLRQLADTYIRLLHVTR